MKRFDTRSWKRADEPGAASHGGRPLATLAFAIALLTALSLAVGCVTKGAYDRVVAERDSLAKIRRDLEAANASLGAERLALIDANEDLRIAKEHNETEAARLARIEAQLSETLASTEAQLAARKAEIEAMRHSYDGLIADLENEVAAGQIQIQQLRSGLRLNLSDEILFPSGSAALNAGGEAVLRKVSKRLVELSHAIQIEGHTDNVPVARRYPSNWELAAARASSVARLLVELGVAPERIKVISRGEYAPVASNDTAEGRAKNRRIEITLTATSDAPGASPASAETAPEARATRAEGAPAS